MISAIAVPVLSDMPKLPFSISPNQRKYCTIAGSFKPMLSLNSSNNAGLATISGDAR